MANAQVWRQRVQAWKGSGKGADDFCKGQDFSASLLRHWAWRLGLTRRRQGRPESSPTRPMPLARVVVARSLETATAADAARVGGIDLDVGGARVHVRAGFDRSTLSDLLDVLEHRAGRSKEQRR